MKSYPILVSYFANAQLEDMWVIPDFEKFSDIGRWQAIERKFPGGLAAEALALGNVWEWCADWYAPYPGGAAADYARPANRYRDMPQNGNDDLGFRLALVSAR